jgi:hypothetical protein
MDKIQGSILLIRADGYFGSAGYTHLCGSNVITVSNENPVYAWDDEKTGFLDKKSPNPARFRSLQILPSMLIWINRTQPVHFAQGMNEEIVWKRRKRKLFPETLLKRSSMRI